MISNYFKIICMPENKTIIWLRNDLRLKDNPALYKAAKEGDVIALYIFEEEYIGDAQKWWLHHSLTALQESLKKHSIKLVLKQGDPLSIVQNLIKETNADQLFWNRCYDPHSIKRDTEIKKQLSKELTVESFNSYLLFEPWKIQNKSGSYFKVFTPFWRHCLQQNTPRNPYPTPEFNNKSDYHHLDSDNIEDWKLLPTKPDWSTGFTNFAMPGEDNAHLMINNFMDNGIEGYDSNRDIPGVSGTSRMSAYLHFGEISPHQIWHKTHSLTNQNLIARDIDRFLAEIGWREFSYHLLYNNNDLDKKEFNSKFANFPWVNNDSHLLSWQKGLTGYPIVDAGMRELWQSGWMHNRVRMIAASFLTKHLLIHWKHGASWFMNTLLDADIASNSASWQWVAGCGADASPYFRIFNPIIQGKKFDKSGDYVRKWVPEIASLPDKYIHSPWEASSSELIEHGVFLGKTYPKPIVDHSNARNLALEAYGEIK